FNHDTIINGLNGAGTLDQGGSNTRTLTLGDGDASGAFAGVISGSGLNVTKIGSEAQALSGSNTYAKTTTVSAGTLIAGSAFAFAGGTLNVSSAGAAVLSPGLGTAMKMPALVIAAGGLVDANDNDLIVGSITPKSTIEGNIG